MDKRKKKVKSSNESLDTITRNRFVRLNTEYKLSTYMTIRAYKVDTKATKISNAVNNNNLS
jgi:hypothetical protein